MARIDEATLRAYITIPTDLNVDQYIADASTLMTARLGATPAASEELATLIEKNLAAHLYTIAQENGGLMSKKVGESTETYASAGKVTGIGSTRFGQMVLALDTTGSFADMADSGKRKAQFRIL